jgi:hypothetical protein
MMSDDLHVLPVNDLKPHTAHRSCKCQPCEHPEEPGLWLHNSWDGREFYEPDNEQVMNDEQFRPQTRAPGRPPPG